VLVVDADPRLHQGLEKAAPRGFAFTLALSGGEALDRVTAQTYRIGLVAESLPDLPPSMVMRALKAQSPETIVISYHLGGRLEIVDDKKTIPIVEQFTQLVQLTERLDELAEAHRQTGRERRYLTAFRERHYEFLRQLAELKKKLEKAIEDSKDTFSG
jgi:CheY-like chemotaxis protein